MDKLKEKQIKSEDDIQNTKEKIKGNQMVNRSEDDSLSISEKTRDEERDSVDSILKKNTKEKEKKKEPTKKDLEQQIAEKDEELRQTHDRLLRTQADYENYKKRVAREKTELLKFGNESLIKELLPVIDNLDISLEHARSEGNSDNTDNIIEGIKMIRNAFLKKLEKVGLREIPAQGKNFDPTKHEATTLVTTSEYPENTVVEELQKGYFIYERLLRPTKVSVAKLPDQTGNKDLDPQPESNN